MKIVAVNGWQMQKSAKLYCKCSNHMSPTFSCVVLSLRFFMIPPVSDLYPQCPGYIARIISRWVRLSPEFSRACISQYTTPASSPSPFTWCTSVIKPASYKRENNCRFLYQPITLTWGLSKPFTIVNDDIVQHQTPPPPPTSDIYRYWCKSI